MEAGTDGDGSAICLSKGSLRHVIDTWLSALVEGFLFFMRGNTSQIARGKRGLHADGPSRTLMFPQITTVSLQGGKGTTITQHTRHLYCHFELFLAKYGLIYIRV